jgi:hypothetical protein
LAYLEIRIKSTNWITSNQINSNQLESTRIKSNQIESNRIKEQKIKSILFDSNETTINKNREFVKSYHWTWNRKAIELSKAKEESRVEWNEIDYLQGTHNEIKMKSRWNQGEIKVKSNEILLWDITIGSTMKSTKMDRMVLWLKKDINTKSRCIQMYTQTIERKHDNYCRYKEMNHTVPYNQNPKRWLWTKFDHYLNSIESSRRVSDYDQHNHTNWNIMNDYELHR